MRKRRGIGNVIASAVMVFLIIFTISQLYIYNLNELDNYNQVAQGVFATNAQKQNEHITISNVVVHGAYGATVTADLTITNTGGTTAHIVSVWMDDVIAGAPHTRVPENIYLGPGLSTLISGLNSGIQSSLNHQILVRVFTELGNSASTELLPPGLGGTSLLTLATTQLVLIPPNPITSNDVIAQLTVTNTNSLGVAFTSLLPDICVVQGKIQPVISTLDSGGPGTQISGTALPNPNPGLTDSSKSWATNEWLGDLVYITSGTGVGQTGRIVSNTSTQLIVSSTSPWTVAPDSTSTYVIRSDCHGANPTLDSGTISSVSGNTLTVSPNKNWPLHQWTNNPNPPMYILAITTGPASGQSFPITDSGTNTLTVSGILPPLGTNPEYTIQVSNCSPGTGSTSAAPVQCTLVQGPTPSSLTYLPPGSTIQFDWTYLVNTLPPGGSTSSITFMASYVNATTTIGLISSPASQNQMPYQTAPVTWFGGGSSNAVGNFASALGVLQIQYSTYNVGVRPIKTDCTVADWNMAPNFQVSKTSYLAFRVQVINTGSTWLTLSSSTAIYASRLSNPGFVPFYIVYYNSGTGTTSTYGAGGNTVTLQPWTPGSTPQTIYFAVPNAGGNPCSNPNPAQSFTNADTYLLVIAASGTLITSPATNYGQAMPFVSVVAT